MNRTVIVTGGFGALGSAVAAAFAQDRDRVARLDTAPAPASAAGRLDIGGVDLADPDAAADAVEQVIAALGPPAVLLNIAGGFAWEPLAEGDSATWTRLFRMNAGTAVAMCRAVLPSMRAAGQGAIVNVGAMGALSAGAGMGPYAASKAAVHRLTEALAAEVASAGITVNAVLPSIIDTPGNRAAMPGADGSSWVQPAAIADVMRFLASRQARAITGALIPVTRGTAD